MDKNKNLPSCIIKLDKKNYLRDRTVCESCYKNNRRKNKNQQPKIDNFNNHNNSRILILGFSTCGKTYLMNHILRQKQESIFIITKSLNQYPNIKAQTSEDVQTTETYEDSIVVFDDMLLSKQESNIDLFFTRGRHSNIDLYFISQSYFHLPRNNIHKFSITIIFLNKLYEMSYCYFMI